MLILVSLGNQISTPLKPGDAEVAQSRLAQVPLATQELKFAAPETDAWRRLNKSWGAPSYVFTVELARNEQGCWDDFHLELKTPVQLEAVTEPLFGHVNACAGRPLGLKFQARGAYFQITVADHEPFPPAELVILPFWPGDMKQHLGEAYVDERLAQVSQWLMAAGGAMLALAGIAAMRGQS